MTNQIKIAIVDKNEIFRDGLKFNLFTEKSYNVIGEASSHKELLTIIKTKKPDVIFSEFSGNLHSFIDEIKYIKKANIHTRIIVNSSLYNFEFAELICAGVYGIVLKDSTREEIINALKDVVAGKLYVPKQLPQLLEKSMQKNGDIKISSFTESLLSKFSFKELNVIYLICKELSSKEIAQKTQHSTRTIEGIRRRVMKKINVKNSAGLISYALKNNIFKMYE